MQLSSLLGERHRIVSGIEYTGNQQQDQRNTDQEPFIAYLDDARRSRRWGVYLQDDVRLTPVFSFTAGLRYDRDSLMDGSVNPRLAAIINPFPGSSVKFLYGSAFRSPSVYEQFYHVASSSPPVAANQTLQPETIKTYEAVIEYFSPGFRTTLNGYYFRIDDLIDQRLDQQGSLVFRNIDRARAQGAELEVEKRWTAGIGLRANYALQRSIDGTTGQLLENSPRQLARLNVLLPLIGDRIVVGIEEQYTDRRKTVSGRSVDDYAVTNVTVLGRDAARTIEISLSCYNVFNTRFNDPVSIDVMPLDELEQDGRTIRLKVTYGF